MHKYDRILIYSKDAMEFAKTKALGYLVTSVSNELTRLSVYGSSGAISNILGTLSTAVLRTYGSSSLRAAFSGSTKYSFSLGTLNELMVRTAKALMMGLALLAASLRNKLIDMMASSGLTRE